MKRLFIVSFVLLLAALWGGQMALAQQGGGDPTLNRSPLHPTFPLLDSEGNQVLESTRPVSTMATCGTCHDTTFIADHSFHASLGLNSFGETGQVANGASWDSSNAPFGRWDPIFYRYLSPAGDSRPDLTTPEWVQLFGLRHVGGGPAVTSRDGQPLIALPAQASNVETSRYDPAGQQFTAWDWNTSGTVEMNCFLCHLTNPDNAARLATLQSGDFGWASTATLAQTGLVQGSGQDWFWNPEAFDADGNLQRQYVTVQNPTNANCGQCHGQVHTDLATPLTLTNYTLADYTSLTTGQIFSPQRLADGGLNLSGKEDLTRTWDVHSERVVACTDCHYALNNPIYYQEDLATRPEHLLFDPRRIELGEYLYRPLHQFAAGATTPAGSTIRRCESCHQAETTHTWLPYLERHLASLRCESCHIPKLYAPSLEYIDWTVLQTNAQPVTAYRGLEGGEQPINSQSLITPYQPVLLPTANGNGATALAPYNIISYWYWVYGDSDHTRPVPLRDLQAAWLTNESYPADILAAFDQNQDRQLDQTELQISNDQQEQLIGQRLAELGLENPRIVSESRAYPINHDVTSGEWAIGDCATCHAEDSKIGQAISLAGRTPGGVIPTLDWPGRVETTATGHLQYLPQPEAAGFYIFGYSSLKVVDWLGGLAFLGVMLGVFGHGTLRIVTGRRAAPAPHQPHLHPVYMYDIYERFWHWLQTAAILLLIFTGLIIHKPDTFGLFTFSYVVQVHNVLAAILVINAALSLFYHLVSGEIQQFLPRPRGFFDQAVVQTLYYLRGIFRGEPHPYEKTRGHKLNPLQQATYFIILNLLLPLQIITGILMWGAQKWPELSGRVGGLPFLAPFHALIAWLFAAFVVMHVYLTTTGLTPTAGLKAMMLGWEEVEDAPTPQLENDIL